MIKQILDQAYKLYMPQIKSEITDLATLIKKQMVNDMDISMGREVEIPSPFNVLEIGTKYGGTFYIWNKLVQNHGAGMCISIDVSDGGIHGGISDEEMDKRDLWFQERFDNCHFIRGDSHDKKTLTEMKNLLPNSNMNLQFGDKLEDNCSIDFLFIDGDHSYEGVKQDFEMYSRFVKPGGLIAFHDIVISDHHHSRNVYVGEFWGDLIKVRMSDNPNVCMIDSQLYEVFEFVNGNANWAGIGCLKKI